MYEYKLHAEHIYTADIAASIDGHMQDAVDELELMQEVWPSVTFRVYSTGVSITGNNQRIVEGAAQNFLVAVKRHNWWKI